MIMVFFETMAFGIIGFSYFVGPDVEGLNVVVRFRL